MKYKLVKNTEWQKKEINEENKQIPIDWSVDTIGKLFKINGGGTPSTTNKEFWDGNIPWLGPKEMSKEKSAYIGIGEKNISELGAKKLGNKKILKDSIIISTRAPVGYLKFAKNDLYTNQGCHSLLPNQIVDNQYMYYWLSKNKYILEKKSNGTTFKELSHGSLKSIEFALPDLNTQKLISSILFKQDSIISNIENLIEKNEIIFNELSEQLLSGYIRLQEINGTISLYKNPENNWKEVEIDEKIKKIPSDWCFSNPKKLNFKIKTGKKDANAAVKNGLYPFFTCSANETFNIDTYSFDTEALLISGNGSTLGEVKYFNGKFDAYQRTYVIDEIKNINFMFLYFKKYFKESLHIVGGSIPFIKLGDIENFNILLPNENEQKLISIFLTEKEELILNLKKLLTKEKEKFEWLLDNLLSGNYLVKEIEK